MNSDQILLVEDNPLDQSIVTAALRPHVVRIANNLQEARASIQDRNVKLVILDVNLPDGDGFKFFDELQNFDSTRKLSIVFLTASASVNERVFGLNLGAQDYICKPVDPNELKARVEARLRTLTPSAPPDQFHLGDLLFNLSLHQLQIADSTGALNAVNLTSLEFNVLYYFARNEDKILTRDQLLESVWGRRDQEVTDRSVDSLISGLRKKIATSAYRLRAVYGSGYTLTHKERA